MTVLYPDIPTVKIIEGSGTASSVGAGAYSDVSIDLSQERALVLHVYVSTSTTDAEVTVVNGASDGGGFVIRCKNNGGSAQDIAYSYKAWVIVGA